MRILFVAENLLYGGREKRFVDLANSMYKRGFNVSLLVYGEEIQIEEQIDENIKVLHEVVDNTEKKWFKRNISYRIKCISFINSVLEKNDYDTIISFDDMVIINLLLSKQAKKSKVIISERGDPNYNKPYLRFIKKVLYKNADGIVFQTMGVKKFFEKRLPKKTAIIPNPVPFNNKPFQVEKNREKFIVSVARLWLYQKRQDILLKAFKIFSKENNEYTLILYGDGPDRNKVQELVEELDLANKVILAGQQDDIMNRIRNASFFVLSSDFEGIPNALIEAMAIGLPVISTDCSPGGADFLIENKKNGLLVKKSNEVELSNAMICLANNPDYANKIGKEATLITEKLSRDKVYNQWEKFITSI